MEGITPLLSTTRTDPHRTAVDDGNTSLTFAELESRARRIAHALASSGVTADRPWAILSRNRTEWVEMFLGNTLAGSRYVPLNWHLTAPEIAYLLSNSGSTLVVTEASLEDTARAAAASVGIDSSRVLVVGSGYEEWRDAHDDGPVANTVAGAPLLYTGGTTGPSKGVVRPDQGLPLERWSAGTAMWGGFVRMPETGTMCITTPLYHAFGSGVLGAALNRDHTIIVEDRFDPHRFLDLVASRGVTSAPLVPTLMVRLAKLDDAEFASRDLSSLQWITHTAAPCPPWAKQRLIDLLGPCIVEFYGSSEGTGPVICTSQDWMERPGTVGLPNPGLQVSVVDENGNDLPPGGIGTLYFRRADGAPRYHGDEEKTRSAQLPDGRFTVGDIGYLDADGYMYLVDRRVDLILNGGVNVYPAEIEGVLSQHPAVRDVAVFGIPDPEFGQQVKAAVELEPGATLTGPELIAWARERLAGFKCPRSVDFHDALPREAHGKLKKRILRDAYWPA